MCTLGVELGLKHHVPEYTIQLVMQNVCKSNICQPGRVAQSVGHLTRKSEVPGSIPGLATHFPFSFP